MLLTLVACGCGGTIAPAPLANAGGEPRTLRDVDWANRTYDTAAPDLTPQPRRFVGGVYDNHLGESDDREVLRVAPPSYADVTGDGVDEALIELIRDQSVFETESLVYLVIIAGDADRQIMLGMIYLGDCRVAEATVVEGVLVVRGGDTGVTGAPCASPDWEQRWRWTGDAFVEVDR